MAYNGSGTYVRSHDWTTDAGNAVKISSTRMDTEDDGFATGLSTAICKDGQTTITANLPMANFRHTGVGAASARTDYARASQVQDDSFVYASAGGTADAITLALSPAITAYAPGLRVKTFASGANTTAVTLNVSGVGAAAVKKRGGTALSAGDIPGAGYPLYFEHDGTDWELLNPASVDLTSTQTVAGDKTFSGSSTFSGTVGMSAKAINEAVRADIASAGTLNLDTLASNYGNVTGTTTTTAITLTDGRRRHLVAAAAWPITTGASLIIEGVASGVTVTCAAGDTMDVFGEASSVVRIRNCSAVRGTTLLRTQTASTSAQIDFVLPSGYRSYILEAEDVVPATDGVHGYLRVSTDSGSSFVSTAGAYAFALRGLTGGGTGMETSSDSATQIQVTEVAAPVSNVESEGALSFTAHILNPASSVQKKNIHIKSGWARSDVADGLAMLTGVARYNADTAVNAVRFLFSSGNISKGNFRLYGVR